MEFIRIHQLSVLLALASICFIIFIFLMMTTFLSKEKKRALLFFTFSTTFMLLSCRYSIIYQENISESTLLLARIWKFLIFFNVLNVSYGFNLFSLSIYKENHKDNKVPFVFTIAKVIIIIGHILLIISQFTNLYYSYDDNYVYHREKLYFINYLFPLIATFIQYFILAKELRNVNKILFIPIILYFILPVLGAFIQLFVQGLSIANIMMGGVSIVLYLFIIYDANNQLKEKERTEADLRLAKVIQENEVPNVFPAFPGRIEFDLYAKMSSAKDVGGDFYDYYFIDNDHLAIVIADVSGKSISGSLNMIKAKVLLRNIALNNSDPAEVLTKLNDSFIDNNKLDMFVTMWFGIIEISTGKVTFANAGHVDAILSNEQATDVHVSKHGIPIGVKRDYQFTDYVMQLNKGDKLFLYTDGVIDLTNYADEEYGINRLIRNIYVNKDDSVKEIINNISKDLIKFIGDKEQFDDITMVCFELNDDNKRDKDVMEVERKFNADLRELSNIYDYFSPMICNVVSPSKSKKYNIVIDEIFSNIVKYGFKIKDKENYINIKLKIDNKNKLITMVFEDNGIKFNPLEKDDPNVNLSLDEREEGGLGIYIVKQMMDKVSYEYKDNKNYLILEKKF